MTIMDQLRSPVCWMGGKHYSAKFIVNQFPPAHTYNIFVDAFGGGANILLTKPAGKHTEIYNDSNNDLVNCWMHLRDRSVEMEERLQTLPYARSLYYEWHASLFDGTEMSNFERAVRWLYVLRSSFRAEVDTVPSGWSGTVQNATQTNAKSYRSSLVFQQISQRFSNINIDCRDFEDVVHQYENISGMKTLIYADPPYIDKEQYYQSFNTCGQTQFHQRLASVLNATPAMVALSYYDHPWLDALYPSSKWRKVTWQTIKHSQRTKATRDKASEVLLMNYPATERSLWDIEDGEAI